MDEAEPELHLYQLPLHHPKQTNFSQVKLPAML